MCSEAHGREPGRQAGAPRSLCSPPHTIPTPCAARHPSPAPGGKSSRTWGSLTLGEKRFFELQPQVKAKAVLGCIVAAYRPSAGGGGADSLPGCAPPQGLIELWQLRDISAAARRGPKLSPWAGRWESRFLPHKKTQKKPFSGQDGLVCRRKTGQPWGPLQKKRGDSLASRASGAPLLLPSPAKTPGDPICSRGCGGCVRLMMLV